MDEHSYRQSVKSRSRELLWNHAIATLTGERTSARLLRSDWFSAAWEYSSALLLRAMGTALDQGVLSEWLAFSESRYGTRNPGDLRIAYLCGPEPENDLRVLTALGVRIENVWAIEADPSTHEKALEAARATFPALKIYHGTVDSFVKVIRDRFDIIYLDFTAPLNSPQNRPYATVHTIFDQQVLAEFAMLIINVAEPQPNPDNYEFLADYFAQQPYIESAALSYADEDDPESLWYAEVAPDQWPDRIQLLGDIERNLPAFYSAFCTQYPNLYANRVQPALRILRVADARQSLFAKDTRTYDRAVRSATDIDAWTELFIHGKLKPQGTEFGPGMDVLSSPTDFPIWWFLENLRSGVRRDKTATKWVAEYQNKLPSIDGSPYKPSREDAVRLSDLLWSIVEGYHALAAQPLLHAAIATLREFPDGDYGLFCDSPLPHLITELAVNQLGYPHHPVLTRHWRAQYRAKSTTMYLDAHVLDQCRPLYDSLPAVPLYADHFASLERQMITRIGLSIIEGATHGVVPRLFRGSAIADRYEHPWSRFANPTQRLHLNTWPYPLPY